MKKSVNMWILPSSVSFEDGLKMLKDSGFEGVEVNLTEGGILDVNSSEKDVKKIADLIRKNGLEVASLLPGAFWKYPLTSSDPEVRGKGEKLLEKSIKIANYLGTDAILVVPGVVASLSGQGEIVSYDVAYKRSQESIKKYVELAEKNNVYICVENVWNKFLLSPLEMKRFVEEIGSEYVRVYFDVGNILIIGFPEMWIRILGKLIKRIHLKDFKLSVGNINGFCDLLEGDVNWPEVIKALKEIGYDSYLTAELGPYKYYPETRIYNTSLAIDKILGRK
ncbi:MAG: sugar phosphate isomerase/epimerase [Candidatus Omnitrophica bacterium]|nr:sugar phosphate isomerase/epimerase [Candidatus Omnitrophota bacterium]MCM8803076.1 sugar phosphate isomerase/epimerase [Candidatus Omnitrophota bacterium]